MTGRPFPRHLQSVQPTRLTSADNCAVGRALIADPTGPASLVPWDHMPSYVRAADPNGSRLNLLRPSLSQRIQNRRPLLESARLDCARNELKDPIQSCYCNTCLL